LKKSEFDELRHREFAIQNLYTSHSWRQLKLAGEGKHGYVEIVL